MPRVETTNIGRRPVRAISTSVTIGGFEVMCRRFIDFEPADVAALRALPGIELAVPRPVLPPNVTTAEAGDGEPVVMRWVSVKHPLTLIENYCYAYPLVTGTPLYVSGRDPHARPRRDFVRGSSGVSVVSARNKLAEANAVSTVRLSIAWVNGASAAQ
jgi:hypothetical protein